MKNKVETYILVGLILVLLSYIVFRKDQDLNYTIPKLAEFNSDDITNIKLNDFVLTKNNSDWFLPSGYSADRGLMSRITSTISSIKIIDMISETKDYSRFGLDSPNTLIVSKNDRELIQIDIGKTSNTGNYTYIKLPNRSEVYSIRGNILDTIKKTDDELRSKVVLTLSNPSEITITKDEETTTKKADEAKDLISILNNLEASTFKELPREAIELSISIKGDSEKSLIVYKEVDGEYPATSSDVDFPFTLPAYIVEDLQ